MRLARKPDEGNVAFTAGALPFRMCDTRAATRIRQVSPGNPFKDPVRLLKAKTTHTAKNVAHELMAIFG
jgi:hypothetical protein